ncbi:cmgc clk protein kinase [Nannochloropsis oceanica]
MNHGGGVGGGGIECSRRSRERRRDRSRERLNVENTCWSQRGEIGGGGRGAGGQLDKRRQQQQQEYRPVDGYAAMAWDGGEGGRQEGRNGIRGKGERDGGQGSGGKHSGRKRERSEERVPPQPAAAGGGGGRSGLHLAEIEQGEKEWRKRQQQEKDREYREQQQQQQSLLQQEGQRKKRQQQQQEQEEEQEEEEEGRRDKKGSEGGSVDDDGESRDDSVGHYQGKPGDVIQGRYVVEKDVGMGTFGRVVQCLDRKRGRKVALKVVRNIKRYTESAQIEADILVDVNSRGGRGMTHCVQLFRDFVFEEHCCLVFERLGVSLYDFLKAHNYRPYPLYPHVRDFARQLLESLEFLHGMQLIHTDLKPENILLCDNAVVAKGGEVAREGGTEEGRSKKRVMEVPASTQVKVIDFGGATYDDDARKSTTINTRQYRGPEVILEVGWSYPSDLWSAGCIIAELYTGDVLFATHNNLEHLALIERCLGPFPREMLVKSPKGVADKFFYLTSTDRKDGGWGRCRWREELDASSQRHVRRMPWLEEVFERDRDSGIIELVRGLVEIDPRERLTATQALALPFFRDTTPAAME